MHGFDISAPPRLLLALGTGHHDRVQAAALLGAQGMTVRTLYDADALCHAVAHGAADMILMDCGLPRAGALRVLDYIGLNGFSGPVVVIDNTPENDAHDPRRAEIRNRAFLVPGPLSLRRMMRIVRGLLFDLPALFQPNPLPKPLLMEDIMTTFPNPIAGHENTQKETAQWDGFIGTSAMMQDLYEHIQNAARSSASVFITGESGTGKDLCAQAIHRYSPRSDKPFVPLNCAAIPRDLLESELFGHVRGAFTGAIADRDGAARLADGGTLFLDEIGDMDPNMQTKLLRFLQDGTFLRVGGSRMEKVDVRIICATNRDPFADMRSGRLREDLFYRLHVLPVAMPPLRTRGDDVIDIAQTLLIAYATEEHKNFTTISPDAEKILRRYDWPGNIRQLQNVIRHAVVMYDGHILRANMLPRYLHEGANPAERQTAPESPSPATTFNLGQIDGSDGKRVPILPLHLSERMAIERAILACSGNIPRAAALLEISPSTIYRKKAQWEQGGGGQSAGSDFT